MILVVALNPALDITHQVADADWAGVNRPFAVHARAGGKGLNVARTLRALGQQVTLAGLVGGSTGQDITEELAGTGIRVALSPIAEPTRRTFTVADLAAGRAALFNEPGPVVTAGEYERFFVRYEKALVSSAAVVLSGSLPGQVPDNAYAGLIVAAGRRGVPVLLDASDAALRHGLAAGPSLVKPNLAELAAATGRQLGLADRDVNAAGPGLGAEDRGLGAGGGAALPEVERAARELVSAGAGAVVVSLGPDGLLAVTPDGCWLARPPEPVPGNPTGAGDAVVAGLADGLVRGLDWPERLRQATALGTAAAAAPVAGEFSDDDFQRLLTTVLVTTWG